MQFTQPPLPKKSDGQTRSPTLVRTFTHSRYPTVIPESSRSFYAYEMTNTYTPLCRLVTRLLLVYFCHANVAMPSLLRHALYAASILHGGTRHCATLVCVCFGDALFHDVDVGTTFMSYTCTSNTGPRVNVPARYQVGSRRFILW